MLLHKYLWVFVLISRITFGSVLFINKHIFYKTQYGKMLLLVMADAMTLCGHVRN